MVSKDKPDAAAEYPSLQTDYLILLRRTYYSGQGPLQVDSGEVLQTASLQAVQTLLLQAGGWTDQVMDLGIVP